MAQANVGMHGEDAAGDGLGRHFWALALGCVGVVYGDIGTSPLYAFREAVVVARDSGISSGESVIAVLSLIVWTLMLIVTIKYVLVLLNADNKGEGGMFALMALGQSVAKRSSTLILGLGIAGASFFFGDAVITPAISVMSAVEGLKLVSPVFDHVVVPASVAIIFLLFVFQSHGTAKVAQFFGPVMVVWFVVLALGGIILTESSLSFLGFGVTNPNQPSWGAMLQLGQTVAAEHPMQAVWPGLAITLAVFSFNMFGDALRDLLDPRLRGGGGGFS